MRRQATDEQWMELAIKEARKGQGLSSPNPPVGAVITNDNVLIGSGWHTHAGQLHAEREAITNVSKQHGEEALQGATLYVTLEPCSSHGRTPPCTDAIFNAGISRVVYGAQDPNPRHAGRAESLLKSAGIEVMTGVCELECRKLIRPFAKALKTGLPWVILKSAISLDGRITRPAGESQWLSSPESRELVQELRYKSDAIITGGNTLRTDNPALTIRSTKLPQKTQPWRMVVTRGRRENLPDNLQVFTDDHAKRTLIQENGDIHQALRTLVEKGCNTVLVEAGGKLMGCFLNEGLVDEVALFYTPMLTGGPDAGFAGPVSEIRLREQQFMCIGDDILLRAIIDRDD